MYFTYDPCAEVEPEEGAPPGSPRAPLLPLPKEDDAYCTFPPGEDLLLFSSSLHGGPSTPHIVPGAAGTSEERLCLSLQEGAPQDLGPPPTMSPMPAVPDPVGFQSPLEQAPGVTGEEVPPPGPEDGADSPEQGQDQDQGQGQSQDQGQGQGQGQGRAAPFSCADTDVYLSLQELQAQDPAHLV